MVRLLILLIASTIFISCEKDDNILKEEVNRGYIEVEIENTKFKFGERSIQGYYIDDLINTTDTIAYLYKSRISDGYKHYDEIRLHGFLNKNGIVDSLGISYMPLRNGTGIAYNYNNPVDPLIISNINYNPETSWLTADFEGYLYRPGLEDIKVHIKTEKSMSL